MQNKIYKKSEELVVQEIDGEYVLVPLSGDINQMTHIYTINETGAFIWDAIDGQTNVAEIAAQLAAEYEISPEQAAKDIHEFVNKLNDVIN